MVKVWASITKLTIGMIAGGAATFVNAAAEFRCTSTQNDAKDFSMIWDGQQDTYLYKTDSGENVAKLVGDRMGPFGTIHVFSVFKDDQSRILDIEIRQNQKSLGITAGNSEYFRAVTQYENDFGFFQCERTDW